MSDAVAEMKLAAEIASHENFMGVCEGGFPLLAFVEHCKFCGASATEKCRRRDSATPPTPGVK